MKSKFLYLPFLLITLSFFSILSCSSDDNSDNQSVKLNILVLDSDLKVPIEGALVEVCNNAFFCTNILASGTTEINGKTSLTFSTYSDKVISESFTVYKDNYMNSTMIIEQLDISKEIVVHMTKI